MDYPVKLLYSTDKSPVSYKTGEPMIFRFTLSGVPQEKLFLEWVRTGDDGITGQGNEEISPEKTVTVTTSIDRPGFVRIRAKVKNAAGEPVESELLTFEGGAGAEIESIPPSSEEPADFMEYWRKQKEKLRAVPLKAEYSAAPDWLLPENFRSQLAITAVKVSCAGSIPVTGYLLKPQNALPHSCKARVAFQGYGPGYQNEVPQKMDYICECAAKNEIVFFINAHGYELLREKSYYDDFWAKHSSYAFSVEENSNPDTAYFNGMALRAFRAFDYIQTLPEWNHQDLIAYGGSQGALQALWCAAHVPGITCCEEYITWCADINGSAAGRLGGWRPSWCPGLAYYDAVFHTRHIPQTCRLEITRAGLGDYTCPPSGIAAQYNVAGCSKKIVWYQNSTHPFVPPEPQTFIMEKKFKNLKE